MKTLNLKFLILGLAAILTMTTSCSKDEDITVQENADSVVGEWRVADGEATAYISGYAIDVEIATSGTISFDGNGRGMANFTMGFDGEDEEVAGPFNWERDGFELVVKSDGETRRWALIDDETNRKSIQFTEAVEDGEVEFTLQLNRVQ